MTAPALRKSSAFAAALCLALGGCIFPPPLVSEGIDFPPEARGSEPALEGDFWLPRGDNAGEYFDTVSIRRDGEGRYHVSYRDMSGDSGWSSDDEQSYGELLKTGQDGIDVLVTRAEEQTLYLLAMRSRADTWVLFPFLGGMDTPLPGARERHLTAVAVRHGLVLRYDKPQDALTLAGKPTARAIAALFSDPAFLAGLELKPKDGTRIFPLAPGHLPAKEDSTAWWPEGYDRQLTTRRAALPRDGLARPARLAGQYLINGRPVTLKAASDGGFVLFYPPIKPLLESWSMRFSLLSLTGQSEFLGLFEASERIAPNKAAPAEPPDDTVSFAIVRRGDGGALEFDRICVVEPQFSAPLARAVTANRAEVGARHGVAFAGAAMTGQLTPEGLRALYLDPQFQVGIAAGAESNCGTDQLERRGKRKTK